MADTITKPVLLDETGQEIKGAVLAVAAAVASGALAPVTLEGTEITLEAVAGTRYICGELVSLDLTPPASGIVDITFTSGETATELTLPDTVTMPDGFAIEAGKIYELNILDGRGVYQAWTSSDAEA